MVLINCYFYIVNVDLNTIDTKYTLVDSGIKINNEIVYNLIKIDSSIFYSFFFDNLILKKNIYYI